MTKKQLQAMSPAETEILRLNWQLGEAPVQKICDQLPPKRKSGYKTVQTLLRRLENKREDVVKRTVVDFLDRLFGGDPRPLMQFLAEDGRIDAKDIERLKKLIDK